MFRLSFFLHVAKVAIVIRLVFRVGGCAMLIPVAFRDCDLLFLWHAIVIRLRDYDWLVSRHAMVIRFAFCDGPDSLVGWLATLCDGDSLVLSITIAIRFLLRDADSLGWFDRLVIDDCFLFVAIVIRRLLCDGDSLGWFLLVAIVDSPCDSDSLVVRLVKSIRHLVVMVFLQSCFARYCCFAVYSLVLMLEPMIIIA